MLWPMKRNQCKDSLKDNSKIMHIEPLSCMPLWFSVPRHHSLRNPLRKNRAQTYEEQYEEKGEGNEYEFPFFASHLIFCIPC